MSEAFTVRIRTRAGRFALWLAPAGGMGLSFPCCADGHDTPVGALDHGRLALAEALLDATGVCKVS